MSILKRMFAKEAEDQDLSVGLLPCTETSREAYSRLCERLPLRCRMTLHMNDPKQGEIAMPARAIDMSGAGALVVTSKPIEPGTLVFVRAKDITFLGGSAYVRHCTWRGWKYRIGLEFRTALGERF